MTIAVVSGKGGAGKTTVTSQLFLSQPGGILLDCDVEEPNSRLLTGGTLKSSRQVEVGFPVVNENTCSHCGNCARFCQFHAILSSPSMTVPMASLCHDCGGCALVCPTGALTYGKRSIGKIDEIQIGDRTLYSGELAVGEYSGVKIIDELKKIKDERYLRWIDGPPGTACNATNALDGADYALIVADPTPFGFSDMKMVVELLGNLKIPFCVVVNKADLGEYLVQDYCKNQDIPILGEIPFSLEWAEELARGVIPRSELWLLLFKQIQQRVLQEVKGVKYGTP